MGSNLEKRSELYELRSFEKGGFFFDLGHPLNRVADSFVKAAGIGAIKAVAREGCHVALEGSRSSSYPDLTASRAQNNKKHPFPYLRGETNRDSLEAMVKSTGKESLEWGLAAGLYSGITYGLREARGTHDWKNSAAAGALTGMTVALTCREGSHEHLLQCAITGAAISTAANILTGIF
ncbi:Outer envelope pore protein 16-2 [Hibiscus syriacus]|uniref:Outer envelope pore protein 16-2 n=1 Tax=Hibiscus syriacus TaxID=106335 RepID=A0A6A2X0S9_HIBSY|nr:outer envelope pore protein 16-2, chloroplastic-like [Hibiscus syriacus]KAE8667951.1 Outer envelope pore protein 16-2 [Hibiscus syriacus]